MRVSLIHIKKNNNTEKVDFNKEYYIAISE